MGKASRRKLATKNLVPPQEIACRDCGEPSKVEYAPKSELPKGITVLGQSECAKCGSKAFHAAGDPKKVAAFYEFLQHEKGNATISLTDSKSGRGVPI